MRDSHFFPTRVSGVGTLTRVDDGRRRSSDGSILGSGDASRYTKRSVEDQWKEQEMLISKENSVESQNNSYYIVIFHKFYVKST